MDNKEDDFHGSYDPELRRIVKAVSSTRTATDRFNRLSSGDRYSIKATANLTDQDNSDAEVITHLDAMFDHLQALEIKDDVIMKLFNYLVQ